MNAIMRNLSAAVLLLLALGVPHGASADPMDAALERYRIAAGTLDADGNLLCSGSAPGGGVVSFCPDNDNWRRLMSQQAFALAPPILSPARTVGYRGFYLGLETGTSGIDDGERYWQLGTRGNSTATFDAGNRFVDSSITWMRLALRKGLPFGFELGMSMGRPFHSSLWMWGVSVKWSEKPIR